MTPDEVKKISEHILRLLDIDPDAVVKKYLSHIGFDELHVLMRAFGCTIGDLPGKVLAYKQGVCRL